MAEIIQGAASERQSTPKGFPFAGQQLLDRWQVNFNDCRTSMPTHGIEAIILIILDGPRGKRPGPDGVPAVVLKRYVRRMAKVFQEAWDELSNGAITDEPHEAFGLKTWLGIPKVEGANVTSKLRDLELGNEV